MSTIIVVTNGTSSFSSSSSLNIQGSFSDTAFLMNLFHSPSPSQIDSPDLTMTPPIFVVQKNRPTT
jgi:hypothetical protein